MDCYKKRVFLSPKAEKPTLTLHLLKEENPLRAAEALVAAFVAESGEQGMPNAQK